jgi:hypothetical protein
VSAAKVGRDLRVQVPGHLSMTISYTREVDVGDSQRNFAVQTRQKCKLTRTGQYRLLRRKLEGAAREGAGVN